MATYKEIHGIKVQYRDSDAPEIEGDVWYNSSTGLLKMYAALGAWSTGGNVGTTRANPEGADRSTQSAGLIFGGRTSGSAGGGETEEYNGTAWSEQNDLNVNRWRGGGAGTQTAALSFGGSTGPTTHVKTCESYDGSSWTEVADLADAHSQNTGGFGTQTAALCVAGFGASFVEQWDGSSWSEVGAINTARGSMALCGSTTAGLVAQGESPSANIDSVEQWDGSSWTEVADCNTTRNQPGGAGISTLSICFGGDPSALTEEWNNTSWTEIADMSTGRGRAAAAGTATSAFCAAGATPGATTGVNATEEWDVSASVESIAFD